MPLKITINNEIGSKPNWLGSNQGIDQLQVMPGGVNLNPAAFTFAAGVRRIVKAGTLVGRTFAERDAGTGYGPWATGDEQVFLLFNDVDLEDGSQGDGLIPYRGNIVYHNFLPGWDTLPAANKAVILNAYVTMTGRP